MRERDGFEPPKNLKAHSAGKIDLGTLMPSEKELNIYHVVLLYTCCMKYFVCK